MDFLLFFFRNFLQQKNKTTTKMDFVLMSICDNKKERKNTYHTHKRTHKSRRNTEDRFTFYHQINYTLNYRCVYGLAPDTCHSC